MSLYAEYIKERAGIDILETEKGFISYQISGLECFIHDAYVRPEHRKSGEAARMLDAVVAIAKEQGCSLLTATVCPSANYSTEAMASCIAVGFRIMASVPNLISLKKEI
jgi:GNAT superfamily N-acetyltransferase